MLKGLVRARGFLALIAVAALAGCAKSGPPPISAGDRFVVSPATVQEGYQLGAGDKVRVSVFNEQQLGGEFTVSGDGALSLPLIGNVPALGKTTAEVAQTIEAKLADGYLRNPQVSMEVIGYRPFFILGEVKAPGQYPYVSGGMTLSTAIATAQGLTTRANKKVVMIRAYGSDKEQRFLYTPVLRIYPGDTVRLVERYF